MYFKKELLKLVKKTEIEKFDLMKPAAKMSGEDFINFIKTKSTEAIDFALEQKDSVDWTALHFAARYQSSEGFQTLIAKASPKTINKLLTIESQRGITPLQVTACYQSSGSFQALIAKANPEAINKALPIQNIQLSSTLHTAARYQSSESFQILVAKASPEAIDKALPMQDEDGYTALHTAAINQTAESFQALINKTSLGAISKALAKQNKFGFTALHNAARNQTAECFQTLLSKASSETLNLLLPKKIFISKKSTLLDFIIIDQPSSFIDIIQRVNLDALKEAINNSTHTHHLQAIFSQCLLNKDLWSNNRESLQKLLCALDNTHHEKMTLATLCDQYFEGLNIHPELAKDLLNKYEKFAKKRGLTNKEKHFQQALHEMLFPSQPVANSSAQADAIDQQFLASLWHKGVTSWPHYRQLRLLKNIKVNEVLDQLVRCQLLFQGSLTKLPVFNDNTDMTHLFKQSNALIKIIKPNNKDWDDFVHQVEDPSYRSELRKKIDNPAFKFVHMQNKIIPYKKVDKQGKQYDKTKKTSTTLITKHLNTPLFGEHDEKRLLVGLIFDVKLCDLMALLRKDSGTYGHQWVGSKEDVEKYAERMKEINCTDFGEFKTFIETSYHQLNEILAKVSKDSIKGIVIGRDCVEARKIAIERTKHLKEKLNLTLPIYFYNSSKHEVQEYTLEEQGDDLLSWEIGGNYCTHREITHKLQLMQLKEKFNCEKYEQSKTVNSFGWFAQRGNELKENLFPSEQRQILKVIEKARQAETLGYSKANNFTWDKAFAEVEKIKQGPSL